MSGSEPQTVNVNVGPQDLIMTIGVKDIYDATVATAQSVRELTAIIHESNTDRHSNDRDVESRLRALEKWRWMLAGTGSVVAAIIAFATNAGVFHR